MDQAGARVLGNQPSDIACLAGSIWSRATWATSRAAWYALAGSSGSIWLRDLGTRSTWATGRTTWLALAMPIDLGDWPNDSVHPGCLDRALDALGAAGSPWLANDRPIDTIGKEKSILPAFDCFDAACFVRSGTFLHASKLVLYIRPFSTVQWIPLHSSSWQ